MKKYFLLLVLLGICAGAAWYVTKEAAKPQDAVLAYQDKIMSGTKEELCQTKSSI